MRNGMGRGWFVVLVVGLLAVLWGGERAVGQPCEPEWAEGVFGVEGVNSDVRALMVFDDGSGPALYAGGWFRFAGGREVNYVARWDGSSWHPLGEGMQSAVVDLAVFDDGTGPALYASGWFSEAGGEPANYIAQWDGTAWSPLGDGVAGTSTRVFALEVFDDGSGPALYAAGSFWSAGGVATNNIAKWDGSQWTPLGEGLDRSVYDLAVFDDGRGPALYAAGRFSNAAENQRPGWRAGMVRHGRRSKPRGPSGSPPWPCLTTAPDPPYMLQAGFQRSAAWKRTASLDGMGRHGHRLAMGSMAT